MRSSATTCTWLAAVVLLFATTNAIDNWNTPGTTIKPVVQCPTELVEVEVSEHAVVGSTPGIRVEDLIPLRKADYERLIEEARKIANKADEEDDPDLEESTRADIRRLKKAKRKVDDNTENNDAMKEPTVYSKEGLKWNVLKQWSLDLLKEKYSNILLTRTTSVYLQNLGAAWNEVELTDYLNSSFRQQKMKLTEYEELLLAESAPKVHDSSEEAKNDPKKFLESVEKTALDVFVDYDTWEDLENPESESAEGRLKQIQSLLLKDPKFKQSFLYKIAKMKDPVPLFTIAPPGSGHSFNQTQGRWIAVVQGSLRVYLYSHSTLPPHTFPQKASIAEWVEHIYPGIKNTGAMAPMEVTLRPGNVLHVPSGYHLASLACSETMYITLWDDEKDTPFQILQQVQLNLQHAANVIREANVADGEKRDAAAKAGTTQEQSEQEEQRLEDLNERHDEILRETAEEGLAMLMKLLKKRPNRPDILLVASTFEMLNYNHDVALKLVGRVIELTPGHSAGYFHKIQILTNKLNYLMQEVDLKEEDDEDLTEDGIDQGDADPSEEQLNDMVVTAAAIASTIKTILHIDPALRWAMPSDFLGGYNALGLLEQAIGKERVRSAVGAPAFDSADSTDPYHLELTAFD